MGYSLLCMLQLLVVITSVYGVIDLRVASFAVSSPATQVASPYYTQDVDKTINSLVFAIVNGGDETLSAASSGINYDVKLYLCEVDSSGAYITDTTIEVTNFDPNDGSNTFRAGELTVSPTEHYFTTGPYNIQYPGSACSTHSHLCVIIENAGPYTDNDATNDYSCLKFVQGEYDAGSTDCISDVVPVALDVTNQDPVNMTANSTIELTYSIQLKNAGGTAIAGAANSIAFEAFVASTESESVGTVLNIDDAQHVIGDVTAGIDEWETTTYTGSKVTFTVPLETCSDYNYFCVKFVKGASASYDDDDSNNLICISFGDSTSGLDVINCPVTETNVSVTTRSPEVATTVAATSPKTNVSTVAPEQNESGYIDIHVGAVVGIALGCAVAGAVVVGLGLLAKSMLSKPGNTAKVHDSAETGNSKANLDTSNEDKPDETPENVYSEAPANGDAQPVAPENAETQPPVENVEAPSEPVSESVPATPGTEVTIQDVNPTDIA